MQEPIWTRKLSEVLGYSTQIITKKSRKTGNSYETEAIPRIELIVTGDPEQITKDNKKAFRYSVFDMKNNLGYKITCPNYIKVNGVKQCIFTNLVGGALSNGKGWYKADSVALVVANKKA